MKKIIIILFILVVSLLLFKKDTEILIPNEAIRFRIIANSNTLKDQQEKLIIKDNIEKEVYNLIKDAKNTTEVRAKIKSNMPQIEDIVKKYDTPFKINYGYNYFPTKNYKGVLYEAGNYESLVITLGEGLGNNFWCVLFPPLCLLDNEEADTGEVEYQFLVKKLLDKF